jgi:tetratricopeptide (TPR) repeat protein
MGSKKERFFSFSLANVRKINFRAILYLAIILISLVAIWNIQTYLDLSRKILLSERLMEELSYFPSGKFLKPVVIEYQSLVADLVYLRAIQYYGHHLMTDRKYIWLDHIFDILMMLDPHFIGAYDFGSIVLAWDARQINEARKLLLTALSHNPTNWKLAFNLAFIEYMLVRDYRSAGYYFEIASELPESWTITKRWAAFSFAKGCAVELAIEVWLSIYMTTENQKLKELAQKELLRLGYKFSTE